VFGGLNRLLAVAVVAGAAVTVVLAGPSSALACRGGTSAVSVYTECEPTGGGGTPTGGSSGSGNGANASSKPSYSGKTAKALSHAGKDQKALTDLVDSYALRRHLQASHSGAGSVTPSAVGSAFDLGSGPTALLIVLAGTAAVLLGGSGLRVWRNRYHA
jgi:hypothetical protein